MTTRLVPLVVAALLLAAAWEAAATRDLAPFGALPTRHIRQLQGPLDPNAHLDALTDCTPPSSSLCNYHSASIYDGNVDVDANQAGTAYWYQTDDNRLVIMVVPIDGFCIRDVDAIAGTANGITNLFYFKTEQNIWSPPLSTSSTLSTYCGFRYTTQPLIPEITEANTIRMVIHVTAGPCGGNTQTTCLRGNSDAYSGCDKVPAFKEKNGCPGCCPGNRASAACRDITFQLTALCQPASACVGLPSDCKDVDVPAIDCPFGETRDPNLFIPLCQGEGLHFVHSINPVTCPGFGNDDVVITAKGYDTSSECGFVTITVHAPTCPTTSPTITANSLFPICSTAGTAVAEFTIDSGAWGITELGATCPDGSTAESVTLDGSIATVTCTPAKAGDIQLHFQPFYTGCTVAPVSSALAQAVDDPPTLELGVTNVENHVCISAPAGTRLPVPFSWQMGGTAVSLTVSGSGSGIRCAVPTVIPDAKGSGILDCTVAETGLAAGPSSVDIKVTGVVSTTSSCSPATTSMEGTSVLTVDTEPTVTPSVTTSLTSFCSGLKLFDAIAIAFTGSAQSVELKLEGTYKDSSGNDIKGQCTVGDSGSSYTTPVSNILASCDFGTAGVTSAPVTFTATATAKNGACSKDFHGTTSIEEIKQTGAQCAGGGCAGSYCTAGGKCVQTDLCNTVFGVPAVSGCNTNGGPSISCPKTSSSTSKKPSPPPTPTPDATCCNWQDLGYSNWGWTAYIPADGNQHTEELFAGAAQNTLSKGRDVGLLSYTLNTDRSLTYTFNFQKSVIYISDIHVWVGTTPPPSNPGSWPCNYLKQQLLQGATGPLVSPISGACTAPASGNMWVAFHGGVGETLTVITSKSLPTGDKPAAKVTKAKKKAKKAKSAPRRHTV